MTVCIVVAGNIYHCALQMGSLLEATTMVLRIDVVFGTGTLGGWFAPPILQRRSRPSPALKGLLFLRRRG